MQQGTLRADAAASISRILDAAHAALAGGGVASLSRIAEEAGVGVATLYRHFPNRRALASSVYQRVFAQAVVPLLMRFEDTDGDHESLVDILDRISAVFTREHNLMASVQDVGPLTDSLISSHDRLFGDLSSRGRAAGHLRSDLGGGELARLLGVIALGSGLVAEDDVQRRRMIDVLLDSLRPTDGGDARSMA